MEEAADVVVLVVSGDGPFRLDGAELEGCERHGKAELACKGAIAVNQLAQRHHGSLASDFGGHLTLSGSVQRRGREEKKRRRRARLFLAQGSVARYWRIVPGKAQPGGE